MIDRNSSILRQSSFSVQEMYQIFKKLTLGLPFPF